MPLRFVLTLICVLSLVKVAPAAPIPKEAEKGKVSQETIKEWFDMGAEISNVGVGRFGEIYRQWSELDEKEKEGPICFQIGISLPFGAGRVERGKVPLEFAKLPQPEAPFALDIAGLNLMETDMKAIVRFKNLFYLRFRSCGIHQDDFNRIKVLTSLRYLAIKDTEITDYVIQSIAELTNLEGIILDNCKLTENQLEKLMGLKKLKSVAISCDGLSQKIFTSLEKLSKLENLELMKMNFSDTEFASLQKLKNLRHLKLSDLPIQGDCFKEIGKLANIEGLEFSDLEKPISLKFLEPVFNLQKLTRFVCTNVIFEGKSSAKYLGWGQMTELVLNTCTIPDDFFSGFESLKKLNALVLYKSNISNRLIQNLPAMGSLEYLSCWSTEISDEAFIQFKVPTSLKKLDLRGTLVTEKCLKTFAGAKLETLKIQDIEIGKAGIKNYLAAFQNPTEIDLSDCHLTLDALKVISKTKNLKSVKIGLKKCELDHLKELAKWGTIPEIEFRSEDLDPDACCEEINQKKLGVACTLQFAQQISDIAGVRKTVHIGALKFEQKPEK